MAIDQVDQQINKKLNSIKDDLSEIKESMDFLHQTMAFYTVGIIAVVFIGFITQR